MKEKSLKNLQTERNIVIFAFQLKLKRCIEHTIAELSVFQTCKKTFPFDEGWQVNVNGKPQILSRINLGFSGLQLHSGTSKLVLTYTPPYFTVSIIFTFVFLLVYVLLFFILYFIKNKFKNKE